MRSPCSPARWSPPASCRSRPPASRTANTRSLLQVVTIALVVSWIAAVRCSSRISATRCCRMLKAWRRRARPAFDTFYKRFRTLLDWCLRHRKFVIAFTVAAFVASILLFRFVPQQFFPDPRPELMVDMNSPKARPCARPKRRRRCSRRCSRGNRDIENYVAYVGTGSPRFYLAAGPAAAGRELRAVRRAREGHRCPRSRARMADRRSGAAVPDVATARHASAGERAAGQLPVQFRVSVNTSTKCVRSSSRSRRRCANPHVANVNLDWDEPSKCVLEIDQDRARALGVTSAQVARYVSGSCRGCT